MFGITVGLSGPELQWIVVVGIALLSGGSMGAILRRRLRGLDAVAQAVDPDGSPTVSEQVAAARAEVAAIRADVDAAHTYHAQEHLAFRRELAAVRQSMDRLAHVVRSDVAASAPAPPYIARPPLRPAPWPRTPTSGTEQGT